MLEGHSQTTERATKTALRSSTTSTTMASGELFTHVDLIHLLLLLVHNYFLQVPRRIVPPQKAYNLRGVVSRKQDLEISPSPNLEQNSATFLSAGMAPGYIWAFGLHASQRVRSNCAEYLFKSNIKNIIVSVELYCAVLLPQIKIQTTLNIFP